MVRTVEGVATTTYSWPGPLEPSSPDPYIPGLEPLSPPALEPPAVRPPGEAVVNQRKGKLLATYELELLLAWEGTARGEPEVPASGRIRLPYISEVSPNTIKPSAQEPMTSSGCPQSPR